MDERRTEVVVSDETTVELFPLFIGEGDGEEIEVGRADTGAFVGLPEPGVDLIRWLRDGMTVGEARAAFTERYGEDPDVESFLHDLAGAGLVRHIGATYVGPADQDARPRGWHLLGGLRPSSVRWALSGPMRVVWALPWLAVPAILVARPDLLPLGGGNAEVFDSETLNVLLLTAVIWGLVLLHEMAHIVALKARGGAGASLQLSRRLHFIVVQTNMTSVRTVPRSQRYGPYLAGQTWDLTVLLAVLVAQLAGVEAAVLGLVSLAATTLVVFQFAFFVRTDIYFALANWLRLDNLMQDSRTVLRLLVTRRSLPAVRAAMSHLSARELRWSATYAVFLVVGAVAVLGNFAVFIVPEFVTLFGEAIGNLGAGPTDAAFWDGMVFLAIMLAWPAVWLYAARQERRDREAERSVWAGDAAPSEPATL